MKYGLDGVSLAFDNKQIFDNLSAEFDTEVPTVIHGASGCGKTTLLRLVSGLIAPDRGCIYGVDKLRTAYAFQESALFPGLSAIENVAIVLVGSRRERFRTAEAALAAVELTGNENLRPEELSGGMRQRVSLARAIAVKPQLLLADEPFGSLDPQLRERMASLLYGLTRETGMGMLLVSHEAEGSLKFPVREVIMQGEPIRLFG